MKFLTVFLTAVFLSSCVHTAVAPVANPQGAIVVLRVPGVKVGKKPTEAQVAAINKKVENAFPDVPAPPEGGAAVDPGIIDLRIIGFATDMETKRGEKFVGYVPMIVVRSTYPPDAVDRAAAMTAGAYYRAAKKHYDLIPITDLKTKPKNPKP